MEDGGLKQRQQNRNPLPRATILINGKRLKDKGAISFALLAKKGSRRGLGAAPPSATTLLLESKLNSTHSLNIKKLKKERPDISQECDSQKSASKTSGIIMAVSDWVDVNTYKPKHLKNSNQRSLSLLHGTKKKQLITKAISLQLQMDKRALVDPISGNRPGCEQDSGNNDKSISINCKRPSSTTHLLLMNKVLTEQPKPSSLSLQIQRGTKRTREYNSLSNSVFLSPLSKNHQARMNDKIGFDHIGVFPNMVRILDASSDSDMKMISSPAVSTTTWVASSMEQAVANNQCQRPVLDEASKQPKFESNHNFVKQNLRNAAGACRGARNKKFKSKHSEKGPKNREQRGGMTACGDEVGEPQIKKPSTVYQKRIKVTIDPLDDYLDGAFGGVINSKTKQENGKSMPVCARHSRPCRLVTVKKNTSGNKGRTFYCCSMPRGEQCDHFEWAEDTIEAAQQHLLNKSTHSGFVARQVASYVDRFKTLTVPELRDEAKRRGLDGTGNKQPLILRLSRWVRDELATNKSSEETKELNQDRTDETTHGTIAEQSTGECEFVDDDSSTSSLELVTKDASVLRDVNQDFDDNSASDDESDVGTNTDDEMNVDLAIIEETAAKCIHGESLSLLQQSMHQLFGFSLFREGQEWTIKRCLQQQRTLLVAPTGFGKSLCYSLPASMMEGTCIVVSPLLSLIDDQLQHLPPRIPAATLSGGMTAAKLAAVIDDVLRRRIKILFVSPERLTTASFRRLFQSKWNYETKAMERPFPTVSLLCVDEAHCLSQWAHNFRPSYLRIRSLIDLIAPLSVLAVTATAGPKVISDICRSLDIPTISDFSTESENGYNGVKILGCDRDNIDVSCVVLPSEEARLHLLAKLMSDSSPTNKTTGPLAEGSLSGKNVIVYVWRKRDAEVIAENLMASGVSGGVVVYHGGMDAAARSKAQSRFMRGKARVCVCTVAFGLGINKADVDAVVHLNLPASPEHYLQEIGRAGRDGRAAKAIALVLQDEVIVRHSLGYSDLVSRNQVMKLLTNLRRSILSANNELRLVSESHNGCFTSGTLHVALPLDATVAALDMKAESVETLLCLLEESCPDDPLVRVEGKVNDLVAILLKRRHLEKLAKIEHIAMCIQMCGRRVDQENDIGKDAFSRRAALEAYSFGLYEFSVTRCAILLGPHAETRHVFAALRRLQNSGELELSFQPSCLALQIKVEIKGQLLFCAQDDSLSCVATDLTHQFLSHVLTGAKKILDINDILTEVSNVKDECESIPSERRNHKSARLVRFQELVREKVSVDNISATAADAEEEVNVAFKKLNTTDEKSLAFDSAALMRDLLSARPDHLAKFESCSSVALCEQQFPDYTALCLSKFFHGIAMVRTPYLSFARHPMFGKWRHFHFMSILTSVESAISALSVVTDTCGK